MGRFYFSQENNLVQGHPKAVFCKITLRRSKECLQFSIPWGRLRISRWPFHSYKIFVAYLINPLQFFWSLIFCISLLGLSYFSRNISNMRCSVSSPDETPRRELKIRRAAEYFWRTSRCFIWWWNTVSNVWYFFSNKIIFEGEIKDANTKQCFIRFPNTH